MRSWILLLILTGLLVGCSSTQSGVVKEYDMSIRNNSGGVYLYVSLDAETATDTTAGNAPASTEAKIPVTIALKGAQGTAGTDGDIQVKGNPINVEPIDASDDHSNRVPTPVPVTEEPGPATVEDFVDNGIPDDDPLNRESLYTFPCEDLSFTYRDDGETVGVPQQVCLFTKFKDCSEIPLDNFTMVWKNASGDKRELEVADSCSISMASKEEGYGKFRPAHDKEPFTPVAYAPRDFKATEVSLVGKKQEAPVTGGPE